jgi:hypothetical protein
MITNNHKKSTKKTMVSVKGDSCLGTHAHADALGAGCGGQFPACSLLFFGVAGKSVFR